MKIRKVFLVLFAIHLILCFLVIDVTMWNPFRRATDLLRGIKSLGDTLPWFATTYQRNPLLLGTYDFYDRKNLTIYIASWNVNAKLNQEPHLRDWLCAKPVWKKPPDIYAIAYQELKTLSPKEVLKNDRNPDEMSIKKTLSNLCGSTPAYENYGEVKTARLVGIMLTVFVRKELFLNILQSSTHEVATGVDVVLTKMGNKGGVGVSMRINNAYICFVNSHLTAHDENVDKRNTDQKNIEDEMMFVYEENDREIQKSINDHDKIFWMGDLNYRLNQCPSRAWFDNPRVNHTTTVRVHDQLYLEMHNYRVFLGYHEGEIKFKPTYKYDPGTDKWDTSVKQRNPAWCDRILSKGEGIRQYAYNSVPRLKISDHKPIYALFETEFIIKAPKRIPTQTGATVRK